MLTDTEKFEDFDYVINVKASDRVCFGSAIDRDTSPIGKGLSPHQRRQVPEIFPKIGAGYYDIGKFTSALYQQLSKVRSKAGVGPLASKDPRFKERICFRTPSPGRYDIRMESMHRKNFAPFGMSGRIRKVTVDSNPGPSTYDPHPTKYKKSRLMFNFGCPKIINAVETICVIKPTDACLKCFRLCEGDYWHKDYATFLCHPCWNEERTTREIYDEEKLRQFKKIRNCTFMHDHQNTNAAVRTLPQNKIRRKLRIENYLDSYLFY